MRVFFLRVPYPPLTRFPPLTAVASLSFHLRGCCNEPGTHRCPLRFADSNAEIASLPVRQLLGVLTGG